MKRFFIFSNIALFAVFCWTSGCTSPPRERFGTPDLTHPDHIVIQEDRLRQFDAFSRSDIGPTISGDRPFGPPRSMEQQYKYCKNLPRYKTYYLPAKK